MTAMDAERDRERARRARNWALLAVLVALVALFYAITIVRMGGG
jgi:uncharacterized Tic20 family protein